MNIRNATLVVILTLLAIGAKRALALYDLVTLPGEFIELVSPTPAISDETRAVMAAMEAERQRLVTEQRALNAAAARRGVPPRGSVWEDLPEHMRARFHAPGTMQRIPIAPAPTSSLPDRTRRPDLPALSLRPTRNLALSP
ncbi:MAG: hypothetical protein AAFR46_15970 [Pseudomonadota bacterium]